MVIPILPLKTQADISDKVQKSFSLRHQAEALIEKAIKAVEIAVEEGEQDAIHFVDAK